ncbi:hypothetical protein N7478_000138 [Penicillium angulare]|uniref:uncharacterized protein n=1 Tax=Penicillium angulare TaxID=116970 RepID=UPI002540BFF5|nr:uncharacterized protein N7478_000138 [Penicillium angulare]KAJ5290887.1 hypothetical protein N7478_000138 [Penicillium angulare]
MAAFRQSQAGAQGERAGASGPLWSTELWPEYWLCERVSSFAGVEVDVNSRSKKIPDEGWAPTTVMGSVKNKPTVVVEVGVTETEAKLRRDATMWTDSTGGQANIAITIKINQAKPLIKIDKWEWNPVTSTPYVVQHIELAGGNGTCSVSGPSLLIPFEKLLLRAASYPREWSIVLDVEALKTLAINIWMNQQIAY